MRLLSFQLPPSARIQFVSQKALDVWEPKINKASSCFSGLELLTVQHGIRACTTAHISNADLPYAIQRYAEKGLIYVPIRAVGVYSGFAHTHPPVLEGQPWNWFGVVAKKPEDAHAWRTAHEKGDHETMGTLLGYPKCCRDFFNNVWGAGYIDPIWQQAENCDSNLKKNQRSQFIRLNNNTPWESSSMLRYIGTRITPHIPCSHDCKSTLDFARQWIELGEKLQVDGLEELKEILQLPIEWNASHGIAYITTPVFKIETNSVPCDSPYIVQREGTFFPKESAKGLTFPFLR